MKNRKRTTIILVFVGLVPTICASVGSFLVSVIGKDLTIVIAVFSGLCLMWNGSQAIRPILAMIGVLSDPKKVQEDLTEIIIGATGMFLFIFVRIFFVG